MFVFLCFLTEKIKQIVNVVRNVSFYQADKVLCYAISACLGENLRCSHVFVLKKKFFINILLKDEYVFCGKDVNGCLA